MQQFAKVEVMPRSFLLPSNGFDLLMITDALSEV